MDYIAGLVSYISGFFDYIGLFFTETLPAMLQDAITWMIAKSTIAYIDTKIWTMKMAWGIASNVLDAFNIGPVISGYVSSLSPNIAYGASAMGIFDALNIVIQAGVSSWVMRFMRV